jgi:hypothetical protein
MKKLRERERERERERVGGRAQGLLALLVVGRDFELAEQPSRGGRKRRVTTK